MTDPTEEPSGPRKGALIALLVILVLLVGGLWLQRHMRADSQLQDCVMAGRKNCVSVTP